MQLNAQLHSTDDAADKLNFISRNLYIVDAASTNRYIHAFDVSSYASLPVATDTIYYTNNKLLCNSCLESRVS